MIKRIISAFFDVLLMLLVVLVLGVVWLLGTTSGARFAVSAAQDFVPALQLEVTGGSLWRGVSARDLNWEQEGLRVAAWRVAFRWRPGCALRATVCIDRVEIESPRVNVDTEALAAAAEPAPEPEAEPGGRLDLPVAVELQAFEIEDARVVVDGIRAEFELLRTGVAARGDQVRIDPTLLRGVRVTLPELEPEPATAPEPEPESGDEAQPLLPAGFTLPEITLPLDVHVERFELVDARLRQGELNEGLDRLLLEVKVEDQQVTLNQLSVRRAEGELTLNGELSLAGDWPLDFEFDVQGRDLPEIGDQRLTGSLAGSARHLQLQARATGAIAMDLDADARLLDSALPWSITLTSDGLRWPLAEQPALARVRELTLEASGEAMDFNARLDARVDGADIPEGRWALEASGNAEAVVIEQLTGETLEGTLRVEGRAGWADGVRWQASLQADGLVLDRYLPDLQPRVGGRVAASGTVENGAWSLDLEIPGIEGQLAGYPLAVSGQVSRSLADVWRIAELRLSTGPNRVRVDGTLDTEWDAVAELDLPELDALWPGLAGALGGSIELSGPRLTPTIDAGLQGDAVAFQDNRVQSLELDARVADGFQADSRVRLIANGIAAAEQNIGDLTLLLEGTRSAHDLELTLDGEPAGVDLALGGSLDSERLNWSGRLARARLDVPGGAWTLADAVDLAWNQAEQRANVGAHCWEQGDASLCLPEPLAAGPGFAQGTVTLNDYDLASLEPWLPPDLTVLAQVDARATVDWDGGERPRVDAAIESRGGTLRRAAADLNEPLELTYDELLLTAELDESLATVALTLSSDSLGQAQVEARINPFSEARELAGEVALDGLRVDAALPFVPALRDLEGRISVQGELGGVLASPLFNGEVRLEDGLVVPAAAPTAVENIELVARIRGQSAVIEGGFRMGDGQAVIGGSIDWADQLDAIVALNGDRLIVNYPPYAEVAVSPAMTVTLTPEELAVNGRIGVPWARITVESLPPSSVSVSSDVILVNGEQEEEEAEQQAEEGGLTLNSNVYLVLGDDVRFVGFGVEGRLAGALQLRQAGTAGVEAAGDIRLEDGVFEAYGQELEIRRGQLLFSGPISEPRLDIEAVRNVDDVVAGLRVTGPASQPEVELFSEPTLPEGTILAYIITGSAPGGGSPSEEALVAQAALSAGVFGGAGIGTALAEQFGVEDFRLETEGAGEETQVAVSGYITPNLLLRYGVGVFQPENTLTLRYYLTQSLYLEAVSGFENALDVFYSFDF